jgi:hypothetical protein
MKYIGGFFLLCVVAGIFYVAWLCTIDEENKKKRSERHRLEGVVTKIEYNHRLGLMTINFKDGRQKTVSGINQSEIIIEANDPPYCFLTYNGLDELVSFSKRDMRKAPEFP